MAKNKLHIPGPDDAVDRSDVSLALLISALMFALFGIFLYRAEEPEKPGPRGAVAAEALDPLQVELKAQRQRSQQLAKLTPDELAKMTWSEEDQRAVFRFGPRAAAESICDANAKAIAAGTYPSAMALELEKTLDRRTEFAPWTCMTRLYLAEKLPPHGDLHAEMAEFWSELEAHEGNARLPVSILNDFRESRDRPQNPAFYSWLRMCAFDFDYGANADCQRILYQIAPAQGRDMLEMLERHWIADGIDPDQMPLIIAGLGRLARNGQPHNWRIVATDELPDYDVDFRHAVVGYLCRMVNTPSDIERQGKEFPLNGVPALASEQLRTVARSGARAYEKRLLMRWRETCRLSFGGLGGYRPGEEAIAVPLLAVWNGEPASKPDFSLKAAADLGTCELHADYPAWYCLARRWRGEGRSLDRALAHFFVETRYMEWDEAFAD